MQSPIPSSTLTVIDQLRTLDLQFQGQSQVVASYLLPSEEGGILIESGPGSTFPRLQARLAEHGRTPADVSKVLLTHIHLDHAGAAGHLAEHGATIYVHRRGATHLANPSRLLKSARRIYGDDMDRLWGEMRSVPEDQIVAIEDEDTIDVGDGSVLALDTPGHASHHLSYIIGDVCFTGDVAGVRVPGETHVELPLAPPEIRLDLWRNSLARLRDVVRRQDVEHLAPTHFGIYEDVPDHLDRLEAMIEKAERWAAETIPEYADDEEALRAAATEWMREQASTSGVDDATWALYELANPSWMAAPGLRRYWKKHKAPSDD